VSVEDLILRVWREGATERVVLQPGGRSEEDRVRRAAEGVALEETEAAWPIDYRVLGADGRLWSVRIDRVTRPTCVAVSIAELPLVPATHILWHGRVACQDVRLGSTPSRWPEGQRWMSLTESTEGPVPSDRCEACLALAPALLERRSG
jgi:hypothetical protein